MSKIFSVAIEKGGVGKTTTAKNIAAGLSLHGKKVLLIDLDSQHHLSNWQGFEPDGKGTLANLIFAYITGTNPDYTEYIRHNEEENIDYIPSDKRLAAIDSFLAQEGSENKTLNDIFRSEFFHKYDYIIFDCPTAVDGILVSNAFRASDKLIIPVQAEKFCYDGVPGIIQKMILIKQTDCYADIIEGIVLTMYHNTNMNKQVCQALVESYGDLVYPTPVPRLEEAVKSTDTLKSCVGNPRSRVGQAYMEVVKRILKKEQ